MTVLKLSCEIKLIATDFDGVFTDGLVYIDENLRQQKKMSYKDIMGVSVALKNDYKVAVISGETSNILNIFKVKFNLKEIHKGIRRKGEVLENLMLKYGLESHQVCYIGDDINDIPAFELVDYKIAPPNSNKTVKELKGIQITRAEGGDGVFREVVDTLLEIQKM